MFISSLSQLTNSTFSLEALRIGRPLIVGGLVDFPPFNYVDPKTGNLTGLDRDIITSLSSRLQINTVNFLTFKTFADLDDALVSGKIDLIANNLWIIPRRSELFSFTIPYYLKGGIASMWLKSRGGPFNTTESLTGTRVATLEGGSYIQSFTRNVSPSEIIVVNSSASFIPLLISGKVDAAIGYFTQQRVELTQFDNFDIENALLKPENAAFAMRHNSLLLNEFDLELARMWKDGALFQIKSKYLRPLGIEPALEFEELSQHLS